MKIRDYKWTLLVKLFFTITFLPDEETRSHTRHLLFYLCETDSMRRILKDVVVICIHVALSSAQHNFTEPHEKSVGGA